jgi:Fic family protein
MSDPSRPPPVSPVDMLRVADLTRNPEMASFISDANSHYYSWDEVRRHPLPLGLTPTQAWTAIKIGRMAGRRLLPLADSQDRPFGYWLPDRAQQILHAVDRRGGNVLASDVDQPATLEQMKERVLIDSLMEEAIATSQIEGAVTTRKVAKEMLRSGRTPRNRSEQMVANGYRTIRLLCGKTTQPLSIDLLHEIQESMTLNTLDNPAHAGRFRAAGDNVCVVDTRDNEIVFTPPPAEKIPERMERLIRFANADPASEPFIHPLVRAAILHFWLAYEHPYVDGNGRTARALFYWSMLRSGYWLFEFLTISRIIHAAPMEYYRSFLHSEQDDNDLTYFLISQFSVTERALADLHKRLREMSEQQERMRALRLAANLNPRQRALLDHALRHPNQVYTFESHQHSHGITYQTARTDLMRLADRGLLLETGSRHPRAFLPHRDLPRKLGLHK